MSGLLKGSLVVIDLTTSAKTTISFQFNPTRLSRTLTPKIEDFSSERVEAVRLTGVPTEKFSIEVQFDGSIPNGVPSENGVAPQLAVLETLVYPTSQSLSQDDQLLDDGTIEIAPVLAPLVLFCWGKRLIPVLIESLESTEDAFDQDLNPIRATVKLGLRVLSASDLSPSDKGYAYYMTYQKWKESMAQLAT